MGRRSTVRDHPRRDDRHDPAHPRSPPPRRSFPGEARPRADRRHRL